MFMIRPCFKCQRRCKYTNDGHGHYVVAFFYEGLPLVLVEAQCAALKCIVSDEVTKLISITDYIIYRGIKDDDIKMGSDN